MTSPHPPFSLLPSSQRRFLAAAAAMMIDRGAPRPYPPSPPFRRRKHGRSHALQINTRLNCYIYLSELLFLFLFLQCFPAFCFRFPRATQEKQVRDRHCVLCFQASPVQPLADNCHGVVCFTQCAASLMLFAFFLSLSIYPVVPAAAAHTDLEVVGLFSLLSPPPFLARSRHRHFCLRVLAPRFPCALT